jgi:choline dehydrogenase-like flavoprotein
MVGGGTVHWQGWLPRFTPNDFRMRTVAGDLKGASLADWPITYDELEPYYLKVEWAFGVSGLAGANRFEGPRSGNYPCPPMPISRHAAKFMQGCEALGWNAFPTPQAALSRPFDGRKATVLSAFAQQHGDPTGTRSSALNVFVPQALATGNYDLRPESYVRELVLDRAGLIRAAVYQNARGEEVKQEADLFILACGAVETARLMLLSKSSRFPNGLANGSDLVGRNVTFHEYSAAVGTYDDRSTPGPAAAMLALRAFSTMSMIRRAASFQAVTLRLRALAFRCRSIGACPPSPRGAPRRRRSIARSSTTRLSSLWCCTTCPNTTIASNSMIR